MDVAVTVVCFDVCHVFTFRTSITDIDQRSPHVHDAEGFAILSTTSTLRAGFVFPIFEFPSCITQAGTGPYMCWLEITRLQYGCGARASGVSSKTYTCRAFQHYSRRKREYEAQHGNDTFAEQSPHEVQSYFATFSTSRPCRAFPDFCPFPTTGTHAQWARVADIGYVNKPILFLQTFSHCSAPSSAGHDMRCSYQATSSHKSDSEDERF